MKLNINNPITGQNKSYDIDDEQALRIMYDQPIASEIAADKLHADFKGYVLRICGGNDKQGFPMMNGVLLNHRTRLLLGNNKGLKTPSTGATYCYRARKKGERKRKSVRGCIAGPDLAAISLKIIKTGPAPIAGLTDSPVPKRLGPKRASNIRKMFNLSKKDDVRKYVIKREIEKNGKKFVKSPKIQRLVTPIRIQRKRRLQSVKVKKLQASRAAKAEYIKTYGSK
eukprot:NODE_651_length_5002_cov_1.533347.p3 type:complete len:226 gc:universal NODE_651_length_5002_cov_1.533347:4595-3918(-)